MNNIYDILVYNGSSSKDFLTIFLTAIWLSQGHFWAFLEGAALLTRC